MSVLIGNTVEEIMASYNEVIAAFQQQLQEKITKAQEAGDAASIQAICVDVQSEITKLAQEYQDKMNELSNSDENGKIYNYPCGVDLDAIVYDGDRDLLLELDNDPEIQRAKQDLEEKYGVYNSRKQLLKTSLKLTEKLAPHIYKIANVCKETLKLDKEIEFYVYQDDKFNAACYPPTADKLYIIISSGMIERFSIGEITFVVGHEIGHILFEHHKYNARGIMDEGADYLSPLHAMKLFAWGRAAEISCDRVGLLCCKSFTQAGSSFFKLSSGVTTASLEFHLDEYINQFVDLKAEMASTEVDPEDWYSSHPFSPLRIKALELFSKSDTYYSVAKIAGKPQITEAELEQEIAQFMSLMNPSYLDQESESGIKIQEYIFMSGYLISMADGTVDQSEIVALGRIVTPEAFKEYMKITSKLNEDDLKTKIVELSQDLNTFLSPMQKLNILRDLCVISAADGEIHDDEVDVLYNLSYFLNINGEFIDRTISDITEEEEK